MAGTKVISLLGGGFVLGVTLSLSAWTSSAEAQAVGQPKVVLGQPRDTSGTEYSIPVGCDAPRDRQSCIVQVSTDFAKFTGGNVSKTSGNAGAVLSLQNDNNLVVYRKDACQAAWARR